jgi:DNA-binding CsgD family transcriptional regulator
MYAFHPPYTTPALFNCRRGRDKAISGLLLNSGYAHILFEQFVLRTKMTDPTGRLTHSERACLQSVARGLDPDATIDPNDSQAGSARKHLESARRKLMASTTIEAVARALKMGLIE